MAHCLILYQARNLTISNRTCDFIRTKKRVKNLRITKLLKRVSIIKYIKGLWSQEMSFYLSSSRRWALHLLPPRMFRHHLHGRCPTLRAWNLQMYTKHRTWYVHCKKQHLKQHVVEINFSAKEFIWTCYTHYLLLVKYVTIVAEQFHFLKFTTKIFKQ